MSQLVPPEALAPFVEELKQREQRRVQRAAAEVRAGAREAAAAAAALARSLGPSAAELRVRPPPCGALTLGGRGGGGALIAPQTSRPLVKRSIVEGGAWPVGSSASLSKGRPY